MVGKAIVPAVAGLINVPNGSMVSVVEGSNISVMFSATESTVFWN